MCSGDVWSGGPFAVSIPQTNDPTESIDGQAHLVTSGIVIDPCFAGDCMEPPVDIVWSNAPALPAFSDGALVHVTLALDSFDHVTIEIVNLPSIGATKNPVSEESFLWLAAGNVTSGYAEPWSFPDGLAIAPLLVTYDGGSGDFVATEVGLAYSASGATTLESSCPRETWSIGAHDYDAWTRLGSATPPANVEDFTFWIVRR